MSFQNPLLAECLQAWFAADRRALHTAIPGRVNRVDLAKGQVDVKPLVKGAHEDDAGARVPDGLGVVVNVPVVFPGAGGFRLTFPVSVGDIGLLIFSEASLDIWLSSEAGQEVDPLDDRRHHLSDGIFIPGLRPFTSPWNGIETGVITIGSDAGPADFVALAAKVDAALALIKTHVHASFGTPSATLTTMGTATGSATVKVKG